MTILSITSVITGMVGVRPQIVYVSCNDTFDQVVAPGFLTTDGNAGYDFDPENVYLIAYKGGTQLFNSSISGETITLSPSSVDINLPVVQNSVAVFKDSDGTLGNSQTGDSITLPGNLRTGNIQAGVNGSEGTLRLFPDTAERGSVLIRAGTDGGDTQIIIKTEGCLYDTTYTIPDLADMAGNSKILISTIEDFTSGNLISASGTQGRMEDAGYHILMGRIAYGGGSATPTLTTTGTFAGTNVIFTAAINASTNAVSIQKANPLTDQTQFTFSADPGASTVISWIMIVLNT